MTERAASSTAVLVCQGRAVADGRYAVGTFSDPVASHLLDPDERALVEAARSGTPPADGRRRMAYELLWRTGILMVPRTVAIDAAVREHGATQVVVLGAGLDTFAYRHPFAGLRVFEVDFPATGAWKRERLAEAGIGVPDSVSHVGVDFESDDLLGRLAETGFDSSAPAEFMWLGVVPYLTREAAAATLRAIASVPAAEVVFDYAAADGQEETAGSRELAARVAAAGEPFTGRWDPAELAALLAETGFDDVEDLGRQEIRVRYLGLDPGEPGGGGHVVRARRPG